MTEKLHQFSDGPYDVLKYTTSVENGEIVIEVNDGDLGRIKLESVEAVEHLTDGLQQALERLVKEERRGQEL